MIPKCANNECGRDGDMPFGVKGHPIYLDLDLCSNCWNLLHNMITGPSRGIDPHSGTLPTSPCLPSVLTPKPLSGDAAAIHAAIERFIDVCHVADSGAAFQVKALVGQLLAAEQYWRLEDRQL